MKTRTTSVLTLALAAIMSSAAILILSACGGSKKDNEIVVATYAGRYQELLTKYVLAKLKETSPDLKVIYALGTDNEHNPKLLAEKGGKGTFDVVLLSATSLARHKENGLLLKLDDSRVPNKKFVLDQFQDAYFIPQIYSAMTLAYNKTHVIPKPDSWNVLYDPAYKGKIGLFTMRPNWLFTAVVSEGGDPVNGDWFDYFDKLLKLRDLDIKIYGSQDALVAGLQSGEVWLSLNWRARNALLTVPGSEELGDAFPKEGTYATWYGAAIPQNANNVEGAYAFLDAMLSVEAEKGFGEEMGYSPTVSNVSLSPQILAKIGFSPEETAKIYNVSDAYLNSIDDTLRARWDQELLR
ncbi:MAG: extracellular solute-binding protein [Treponema sp.]|jgi:putative spermidine/putrescine transport system substrate-binding protein|nr:extracellular solute-binding protein [Treponema sp.]